MAYFDKKSTAQFTGKKYYESLCIKTLNQTIGRGIRHINDYANIYLCDYRFDDIKGKLSNWMRDRIEIIN
jgi:chromosome transmission fidelity protein 1